MSLIKCIECGHEVSTHADKCQNCGCPVSISVSSSLGKGDELYDIVMTYVGDRRIQVARFIREVNAIDSSEAYALIENPPQKIVARIPLSTANSIKDKLASIGCICEVYKNDNLEQTRNAAAVEAVEKTYLFMRDKPPVCPRCGSNQIATGTRGYNIVWGFLGSNQTMNRCGKCGYSWKP